jgi:hypothetical protein
MKESFVSLLQKGLAVVIEDFLKLKIQRKRGKNIL